MVLNGIMLLDFYVYYITDVLAKTKTTILFGKL